MRTPQRLMMGRRRWSPADLGSSLFAWWDAERADLITQSGGAVSSWKDIVAGYDVVQAVGASKPAYSATSFNGRPGVSFDGMDDRLLLSGALPGSFPIAANPGEMWCMASQDALPADATGRTSISYGSPSTSLRRLERSVVTGVNRGRVVVGDGSVGVSVFNTNVDLSGRRIMRGVVGASASDIYVDGVVGTPGAVVPATSGFNVTIGSSSNSASSFWSGPVAAVLITLPLSSSQAAQLHAYLNARL